MCKPTKISQLIVAVRQLIEVQTNGLEWFKSHHGLVTKDDLKEMEKRMATKVSELDQTVNRLQAKVDKIWDEQQKRYDDLVKDFTAVKEQLANVEVPPAAQASIESFDAKLTAYDDVIPDPATPPTE